ncbi:MAG TPA: hypothetical protein VMR70_09940, partial [Flavisolibacter sp.]|nr:hypothetical protein [Flavisolibacter sp.]
MPQRKEKKPADRPAVKVNRLARQAGAAKRQPRTQSPADVVGKREREKYAWINEKWRRHFNHKRKTTIPHRLPPMLASSLAEPFNDAEWQFEIK